MIIKSKRNRRGTLAEPGVGRWKGSIGKRYFFLVDIYSAIYW